MIFDRGKRDHRRRKSHAAAAAHAATNTNIALCSVYSSNYNVQNIHFVIWREKVARHLFTHRFPAIFARGIFFSSNCKNVNKLNNMSLKSTQQNTVFHHYHQQLGASQQQLRITKWGREFDWMWSLCDSLHAIAIYVLDTNWKATTTVLQSRWKVWKSGGAISNTRSFDGTSFVSNSAKIWRESAIALAFPMFPPALYCRLCFWLLAAAAGRRRRKLQYCTRGRRPGML